MHNKLLAFPALLLGGCLALAPGAEAPGGTESVDENAIAFIDPGSLGVHKGRLYYSAWAYGVGTDENSVFATIAGPGISSQQSALYHPTYSKSLRCNGLHIDNRDSNVKRDEGCSFDISAAKPGNYTLSLTKGDRVLAKHSFDLIEVAAPINKTELAVSPKQRQNHLRLGSSPVYWHRMDMTDPVSILTFAWIDEGEIVRISSKVAKGPDAEWAGMVVDVVGVTLPSPPENSKGNLTLIVLKDEDEPLAQFEVSKEFIASNRAGSFAQVEVMDYALAEKVAKHPNERFDFAKKHTQFLGRKYPASLICAVIADSKLHRTFVDERRNRNAAHWAWFDAAVAHDQALNPNISGRKRKQLKERMVQKARRRVSEQKAAKRKGGVLERAARKSNPSCIMNVP
jgi:hypothetical protein